MTTPSIVKVVQDMDARLHNLEQSRLGTYGPGGSLTDVPVFEDGFIIGPNGNYVFDAVPAPTNITVTTGSFFEVTFIDVAWTVPVDDDADQITHYEVELTKSGAGVARFIHTGGTNARFEPVEPVTDYFVRVRSVNKQNRSSAFVNGTPYPIRTLADTTIPDAPTGVVASSDTSARAIQIRWNSNTEIDVKNGKGLYEWEVSGDNSVDANGDFVNSIIMDRTSATVVAAVDLAAATTYYAHVRAIDSSGNFSAWSAIVTAMPGMLVDADIANLSAAKVTFGEMSGDRIQANTADIHILKTSELDAAIITIKSGGMIRMGRTTAPYHYMIKDENGIRFYINGTAPFTGGDLNTDLNVSTGSAFFGGSLAAGVSITSPEISGGNIDGINMTASTFVGGTITGALLQTASSGRRVVISNTQNLVSFHSGSSSETGPAEISTQYHGTEGATSRSTSFRLRAPSNSGVEGGELQLYGQSEDGSIVRQAVLRSTTGTGSYVHLRSENALMTASPTFDNYIQMTGADGQIYYRAANTGHVFQAGAAIEFEIKVDRINCWNGLNMNQRDLWLQSAGTADRVFYSTVHGAGPILQGINWSSLLSQDVRVASDGVAGDGKCITANNGSFRDFLAANIASDERFKQDVVQLSVDECLGRVRGWNPVEFSFKPEFDPSIGTIGEGRRRVSVIAQSLGHECRKPTVLNDVETGEPWVAWTLDTQSIQGTMVGALQSLANRVAELESRLQLPVLPQPIKALPVEEISVEQVQSNRAENTPEPEERPTVKKPV